MEQSVQIDVKQPAAVALHDLLARTVEQPHLLQIEGLDSWRISPVATTNLGTLNVVPGTQEADHERQYEFLHQSPRNPF
jgi:hypothetical protein